MQLVHEANSEKQVLTAPLDIDVTAHRIRSVEIVGGFLDGARFEFADGLNCLIGARGAGKTTVVELIRYALDELPAHDTRDGERRRIETLVEHNLGGGRVQLSVETKEGLAYIVSRSPGEEPIVQTIDGEPTDISLKSGSLFRADIYSQNEIESIADRTSSQLELIDNFELEHIAEVNVRIGQLRTELAANASEIIPIQSRIAGLGEELGTLTGVEDKLGKLAS
ncbi:MAG: ATP-binding protein, partial [Pirellulaceae bacterium]|nr:ATP-binding protein [Pirellulaceae bacterium]